MVDRKSRITIEAPSVNDDKMLEGSYLHIDSALFTLARTELRLQIYDLAHEDSDWGEYVYAPWISRDESAKKPWRTRSWQYYGLTQVCQQLRTEFRPIWLRSLRISIELSEIRPFLDVFFPEIAEKKNIAPASLDIIWPSNYWKKLTHDLTRILQLTAYSATTHIDIISVSDLHHNMDRWRDRFCKYCLYTEALDQKRIPHTRAHDNCTKNRRDEDAMRVHRWVAEINESLSYLEPVTHILSKTNEQWRQVIRAGHVRVSVTPCRALKSTHFIIDVSASGWSGHLDRTAACNILKDWGLPVGSVNRVSFAAHFRGGNATGQRSRKFLYKDRRGTAIKWTRYTCM